MESVVKYNTHRLITASGIILVLFIIYFGLSFNSNRCRLCSSRFNCKCENYVTNVSVSNTDPGFNNLTLVDENNNMGSIQFPSGIIIIWNGSITTIPNGWTFCDGTLGTPDLRGRFIISVNSKANNNTNFITTEPNDVSVINNNKLTLTTANLPSHSHTLFDSYYSEGSGSFIPNPRSLDGVGLPAQNKWAGSGNSIGWNGNPLGSLNKTLANTGTGESISTIPPYYSVCYIMKL